MATKKTAVKTAEKAKAPAADKKGKGHKAPVAEKAPAGRPKTPGLRKPQLRILAFLAKAKGPQTRRQVSEGAPVDNAFCTEYIGSSNPEIRAKNDATTPSLLTLKYVKAEAEEGDGGKATTVYAITDAGRKALAAAKEGGAR